MSTGVYKTTKKDGSVYYRVSITIKNKHISLGSFSDENSAASAYKEAVDIINFPESHWINTVIHTTSYKDCFNLSFEKYIILLNFRDNKIYIKTPIYLCQKFFLYFLNIDKVITFDNDDLFYYSTHKIICRGGYYFVNDFGIQTSILSRYGIHSHSVCGRDYIFKNGDLSDYRYKNVYVINSYHGVTKIEKKGIVLYRATIHINGCFVLGDYSSAVTAALAYNKAVDILSEYSNVKYELNFIENLSPIQYASTYNSIRFSKNFRNYINAQKIKTQ